MASTYTMEEVQKHKTPDDVWIVFHNKVYDVTKYLENHPGGPDIILEVAATDATEAFEDIGHSEDARDALAPLYVGDLASEEHSEFVEVYRPSYRQVSTTPVINVKKDKSSKRWRRVTKALATTSITGAAVFGAYHRVYRLQAHFGFLNWLKSQTSGSSGQFWSGFVIATVGNVALTLGLSAWAWSKLDVQQEFTHFSAHIPSRKETLKTLPKLEIKTAAEPVLEPVLDAQKYRKFPLVKKIQLSPNVYRFVFALRKETDTLGLPIGQHIAIRADINGKSVSRSYTPTSNDTDLGRLELVVKVYPGGLITNYLANLEVGDEVEIRGPKGAMKYNREYSRHILMVAGGTGITPMYQLIRAICTDDSDNTGVSLIYANNTEEDILLREELDAFATKCPQKFKVHYVLAKPPANWEGGVGFVTQEMIKENTPPISRDMKVLLCGPPPMINAMKKNLGAMGFQLPGPLARVTDQIFLF